MRQLLIFIPFLIISCTEPLPKKVNSIVDTTPVIVNANIDNDTIENYDYQTKKFELIKSYPIIEDTLKFIKELKQNCHLFERKSGLEKINYFKKIKISGSNNDYFIVEYDFKEGAMSSFPWKNQIIFNSTGKLIKVLSNIRIDVVKIFKKENPFLICVSSTAKGNGWHEIYKIQHDTLANIYEGMEHRPQTYDAHQDNSVNEPTEFQYKVIDMNNDNCNDIVFSGNISLIEDEHGSSKGISKDGQEINYSINNPYKRIPVTLIFLYNPKKKHFIEKEDYSKKFEYIFGNSN
jgi:hypothetical protein